MTPKDALTGAQWKMYTFRNVYNIAVWKPGALAVRCGQRAMYTPFIEFYASPYHRLEGDLSANLYVVFGNTYSE